MTDRIDALTSIANKRGFFWPTAEIYGGMAGLYTYGHLGKLLKTKFENLWRDYFLSLNDNFYEIESNTILPKQTFVASGHIEHPPLALPFEQSPAEDDSSGFPSILVSFKHSPQSERYLLQWYPIILEHQ